MELSSVKGIGDAMAQKLESAGIGSVRELATLKIRSVSVDGIGEKRLKRLKKEAQKTIYADATRRLVEKAKQASRVVADAAMEWEVTARTALKGALEAAWEAEHRALDAVRASRERATELAQIAAMQARSAQRTAAEQAAIVLDHVARAPQHMSGRLQRYADSARQADSKARAAADKATQIARNLASAIGSEAATVGRAVGDQAKAVGKGGASLMARLKRVMNRRDDGSE